MNRCTEDRTNQKAVERRHTSPGGIALTANENTSVSVIVFCESWTVTVQLTDSASSSESITSCTTNHVSHQKPLLHSSVFFFGNNRSRVVTVWLQCVPKGVYFALADDPDTLVFKTKEIQNGRVAHVTAFFVQISHVSLKQGCLLQS